MVSFQVRKYSLDNQLLCGIVAVNSYSVVSTSASSDKVATCRNDDIKPTCVFFGSCVEPNNDHDGEMGYRLNCLNLITGKLEWQQCLDAKIVAAPFYFNLPHDDTGLHVAKRVKQIEEINQEGTGCTGKIRNVPVVIVTAQKGSVLVVDARCGDILTRKSLNSDIWSAPVVYNNKIVFGCRDNYVHCYDISLNC